MAAVKSSDQNDAPPACVFIYLFPLRFTTVYTATPFGSSFFCSFCSVCICDRERVTICNNKWCLGAAESLQGFVLLCFFISFTTQPQMVISP